MDKPCFPEVDDTMYGIDVVVTVSAQLRLSLAATTESPQVIDSTLHAGCLDVQDHPLLSLVVPLVSRW